MSEAKEKLAAAIADAGLTILARFVPFSLSRNSKEKDPSLNWVITLQRNGRDILTTDYMAGCGHCPAYKNPSLFKAGEKRDEYTTRQRIRQECETGKVAGRPLDSIDYIPSGKAILPDTCDVVYSLVLDASAIDCGSFADWCNEYGYSDDSIKAKETFDQCVAHGMKLRAAIGSTHFETIREACNDY